MMLLFVLALVVGGLESMRPVEVGASPAVSEVQAPMPKKVRENETGDNHESEWELPADWEPPPEALEARRQALEANPHLLREYRQPPKPTAPSELTEADRRFNAAIERATLLVEEIFEAFEYFAEQEAKGVPIDSESEEVTGFVDAVNRAYEAWRGRKIDSLLLRTLALALEETAKPAPRIAPTPRRVRAAVAVFYPDVAAKMRDRSLEAAIAAWRSQYGKWEALHALIRDFDSDPPTVDSIKRQVIRMLRRAERGGDS